VSGDRESKQLGREEEISARSCAIREEVVGGLQLPA
jgi:hypothetical protein